MTVRLHPPSIQDCRIQPCAGPRREPRREPPRHEDSATFSIGKDGKLVARPVRPEKGRPAGRVRFAPDPVSKVMLIESRDEMSLDESKDMYLTRDELLLTRKEVRTVIASCFHLPSPTRKSLDDAFLKVIQHGWRTGSDDEIFDAVMHNSQGELNPSIEHLKVFWEGDQYSNRGLERLCSPEQKRRRTQFTKTCHDHWINNSNGGGKDNRFFLECNRTMTLFARAVAFADELAAKEIHQQSQ